MWGVRSWIFSELKSNSESLISPLKMFSIVGNNEEKKIPKVNKKSLTEILDELISVVNEGTDFAAAISVALKGSFGNIPKKVMEAKLAAVETTKAGKDYRVSSTFYGGIEDITDNVKGVALGLNASRLIFDSGLLDTQIASKIFEAETARIKFAGHHR